MFGFILLGSFFITTDLYAVIWVKFKDLEEIKQDTVLQLLHKSLENKSIKVDSEEPLLLC